MSLDFSCQLRKVLSSKPQTCALVGIEPAEVNRLIEGWGR
ncbi:hypothetical protein HDA44_004058 [Kribbella solani]|uniref:Uncharacterized protein n=1 Tax=Kribbella solani TaxID=236067 RepID=A0A841DWV1_9ACTN|nr:hypothetical protein [Kribbella solani]